MDLEVQAELKRLRLELSLKKSTSTKTVYATQAEVNAGTSIDTSVSPATLSGWTHGILTGFKNFITNGRFEVNQRGKHSYTTTSGDYSFDRFYIEPETLITKVKGGVRVSSGNLPKAVVIQPIEILNGSSLVGIGEKLTLSFDASIGINSTLKVEVVYRTDIDVDAGSPLVIKDFGNGSGSVQNYQVTFVDDLPPVNSTMLMVKIGVTRAGQTDEQIKFLSNIQLERGNIATPYEVLPISIQDERCRRYYEVLNFRMRKASVVDEKYFFPIAYTTKRTNPSVTVAKDIASAWTWESVASSQRTMASIGFTTKNNNNQGYYYGTATIDAEL